jgi:chemotaxis signal transduction protein
VSTNEQTQSDEMEGVGFEFEENYAITVEQMQKILNP